MRRSITVLLALLLAHLPTPAVALGSEPAALLVGDPIIMHRQVLADIRDRAVAEPIRIAVSEDPVQRTVELSQRANPDGAATVYLASDATFADALAAGPLVRRDDAALLLTDPQQLPEGVAQELVRLRPERVVVLGGSAAISDAVVAAVEETAAAMTTRLAGPNRFATSAAVAMEAADSSTTTVFLATGNTFADALAAMPAVDADQGVILLTDEDRLPPETEAALGQLDPSRLIILGGEEAVGQDAVDAADALTRATPLRLGGSDRYQTAQVIDGYALGRRDTDPGPLYVVSGNDWRDALAVGPVVAGDDARLLVADTTIRFQPLTLEPVEQLDADRQGNVTAQVMGTGGQAVGYRADQPVAAVSTLKIMFMTAYLRQSSVAGRALSDEDRALLQPMITQSDNTTASTINRQLGTAPLDEIAAEVGMQDFVHVPSPWGNTRTSARDQVLLMAELPRLLPDRHRSHALDLLTQIVPEQQWGIGQLDLPGWTVRFKGGWGSATGSVNHQSVRLEHRDGAVVSLAVTTTDSPSHAYASETLELVFREVLTTLP